MSKKLGEHPFFFNRYILSQPTYLKKLSQ